jgi:DNA-binding Xre family transcriptional regulator
MAKVTYAVPNLRIIRERAKISQIELAEKIGMHRKTLQRLENGLNHCSGVTLEKLCEALGCTREDLMRTEQAQSA